LNLPSPNTGMLSAFNGAAFNGIYDKNGAAIFYVNAWYYNSSPNSLIGGVYGKEGNMLDDFLNIPSSAHITTREVSIVPFMDNTSCSDQRYYIFYAVYDPNDSYLFCKVATYNIHTKQVTVDDIVDGNGALKPIAQSGSGYICAGLAASNIHNGVRYLYFSAGDGIKKITISTPTPGNNMGLSTPVLIFGSGNVPSYHMSTNELDLSPDDTKLAWGYDNNSEEGYSSYHIINLDASTGNWNNVQESFTISAGISHLELHGVEFNATGTELYVATGNTASSTASGIYVRNIAAHTHTLISGTRLYGNCQIERAQNGLIYVSTSDNSSNHIAGIDPATKTIVTQDWVPTCGMFPDQIDGYDYEPGLALPFNADLYYAIDAAPTATWTMISNPIQNNLSSIRVARALNFIVPGTYTLQNMVFEMNKDAVVNVGNGVTLNLVNTVLKGDATCGGMWQGIKVANGGTINTNTSPAPGSILNAGGYLSKIYDAVTAITITGNNARYAIYNTEFDANFKHIQLVDCYGTAGVVTHYIASNRFLHNQPLKDQSIGVMYPFPLSNGYLNHGKTSIDMYNSGSSITHAVDIALNLFDKGIYGVTSYGVMVKLNLNVFKNMDYGNAVAVNVNMKKTGNNFKASSNEFYSIINPVIIYNGAKKIEFTEFNQVFGYGITRNALNISQNPNCEIIINRNGFNNFIQNGILLYNNAGTPSANQATIQIDENGFTNYTQYTGATGITIHEDGQTKDATYRKLKIAQNAFDNLAYGIKTFQVVGHQDIKGEYNDGPNSLKQSDFNNNAVNYFATATANRLPTDYNTGVQLNNSKGLNIVNNTIASSQTVQLWRNMGVACNNTMASLVRGNTIKAGRGIAAKLSAYDNNYLCNTFNGNVNGISLNDHFLRNSGDVHGVRLKESRENSFNNTLPNGSDIELYIQDNATFTQLRNMVNSNQWLFTHSSPFTLIFPDPNLPQYFNQPPSKQHFNYIFGGRTFNTCAISPPDDGGDDDHDGDEHGAPMPDDSLAGDTFIYWQQVYDYELYLKTIGESAINPFMSQLIDLQELIATSQYEEAHERAVMMETNHIFGLNYLTVYHTIIDARTSETGLLTSAQVNTLSAIAAQNPKHAGASVYIARGMLWCEAGLEFYDAETDREPGIGARIRFGSCSVPEDLQVKLIDETGFVYNEIPVMLSEEGKVYVMPAYLADLDQDLTYKFQLNYPNNGPGLMTLNELLQVASNNYYLDCGGAMTKKGNDPKPDLVNNNELTSGPIRIYPNPANTFIHIDLPGDLFYDVELHNLLGQKIYTNKMGKAMSINTINFEGGVYFIKIIDASGQTKHTERIVIVK
ncbi:MAG: T9SS type A sorting domain-containing protein, partial [Bacteroidota bacterium]